ncbi:MAG: hypothetical protein VX613_03925, partial [Candidatus Thermoplasmatota archaeon]|nr:hypothetical protein [Candidatus Thermoplasmatota archaeon]
RRKIMEDKEYYWEDSDYVSNFQMSEQFIMGDCEDNDEEYEVREEKFRVIDLLTSNGRHSMSDTRIIKALNNFLEDEDEDVKQHARKSLESLDSLVRWEQFQSSAGFK